MIPFGRDPNPQEYDKVYHFIRDNEASLDDRLQSKDTSITAHDILRCIVNIWPAGRDHHADQAIRLLMQRLNFPPEHASPQLFDEAIARKSLKIAIACLNSIADQSDESLSAAEAEHALNLITAICEAPLSPPKETHAPSQLN
jgi:hypothetical protein